MPAYGVSRITVRQAIVEAVSEGLLFTRQGKGTFVEDQDGCPVEYRIVHYRGDRYRFSVVREVSD